VKGEFAESWPPDLPGVTKHRTEIEAAGAGTCYRRTIDRAWYFDRAVARDPAVAFVIEEGMKK
jgi:hypothetical protein